MPYALVTGSAGGVGESLCAAFQEAGYFVIGVDRQKDGRSCNHFIHRDIRQFYLDPKERTALIEEVREVINGEGLKTLVNNAATQILHHTEEIVPEEWEETLETNLLAPFTLIQALLPQIEKARGSVVNICSIHAVATKPGFVCYATSKAAMGGLTRALAVDLGPRVRVNAINLAATATPMLMDGFRDRPDDFQRLADMHPLQRIATTEEVARTCVYLASDEASFISGASWHVDGGIGCRLHDPA